MVCLGFKPGAAGWKAQMNPLSYGGTPGCQYLTSEFGAGDDKLFVYI